MILGSLVLKSHGQNFNNLFYEERTRSIDGVGDHVFAMPEDRHEMILHNL